MYPHKRSIEKEEEGVRRDDHVNTIPQGSWNEVA